METCPERRGPSVPDHRVFRMTDVIRSRYLSPGAGYCRRREPLQRANPSAYAHCGHDRPPRHPRLTASAKLRVQWPGPGPEVPTRPPPGSVSPGAMPAPSRSAAPPRPLGGAAPACASPCSSARSVPPARSVGPSDPPVPASPTGTSGTLMRREAFRIEQRPYGSGDFTVLSLIRPPPWYARASAPSPPGPSARRPPLRRPSGAAFPAAAAGADRRTRTYDAFASVTDRSFRGVRGLEHRRGDVLGVRASCCRHRA